MISLRELALLEEGRLVRSISEVASEARLLPQEAGGGLFARGEPGTWCNVGVGLGLAGPVSEKTVDELIEWHASIGVEPRAEVTPFAHPTLVRAMADRSFVVRLFENVFYREIPRDEDFAAIHSLPRGIDIAPVDPADEATVHECGYLIAAAFAGDTKPMTASVDLAKTCIRHARTVTLGAFHEGRVVSAGSVELLGDISALFGLCVHPDFRRRGIQQALIAARLRLAADRGARVATISARPGVATEGNARRMGFQVAYTKVIMARPGKGLAPVVD